MALFIKNDASGPRICKKCQHEKRLDIRRCAYMKRCTLAIFFDGVSHSIEPIKLYSEFCSKNPILHVYAVLYLNV